MLVLHSAAGFLGSAALRGLIKDERQAKQLKGGVIKIVFLCPAIMPEGTTHMYPLFIEIKVC